MSDALRHVHHQAALLEEQDRAELAYLLLESLEGHPAVAEEEAWNRELARRLAAVQNGEAEAIPSEEVHQKMRSLYL